MKTETCPVSAERVRRHGEGEHDPEVAAHIETCPACASVAEYYGPDQPEFDPKMMAQLRVRAERFMRRRRIALRVAVALAVISFFATLLILA